MRENTTQPMQFSNFTPMGSGTTVVILAAGKGTRMKSSRPKVLAPICGRSLIEWVVAQATALDPDHIVVVVGEGGEEVEQAARAAAGGVDVVAVEQVPQLGTGHAVQMALPTLADAQRVVVLYGDMPLLRPESLRALVDAQREAGLGATAILSAWLDDPTGYGRILRAEDDAFQGVIEQGDADPQQLAIGEVNTGVYCFDGPALCTDLPSLTNENSQGEYYLTDVPGMAVAAGRPVVVVELEEAEESLGINTMGQLADARWAMQMRILEGHLEAGVHIEDPASTYIDQGVSIGSGTTILPCTVIRSGVVIGAGCEVGPFTHLRGGTVLEDGAQVGNFTECKQATLGAHTKAKHLSYLGNVSIGKGTNIGAGTIFANYDGVAKHETTVADDVFMGSGTIVVAPNHIPQGSTTGAGAVLTRSAHMQPGEVWVGVPARKLQKKGTPTEE